MTARIINGKEYVETSEAVKISGLSESHIRFLARKSQIEGDKYYGKLPCIKVFGRWAYEKESLLKLSGIIIDSECEQKREVVENGTEDTENGGTTLDI
jgi:hypothetical protein